MPDLTPAEKLTAAADLLDALIADVYPLPWHEGPVRLRPHRGIFDAKNREIATAYEQSDTPKVSALVVALVNAGPTLVALLRFNANIIDALPLDRAEMFEAELALADAILAAKEGT
jgi:hypothetical protein